MNLKMTGIKQANANLNEIARRLKPDVAAPAIAQAVIEGTANAKLAAPVDTGELVSGIIGTADRARATGKITSHAPHSAPVEYGTMFTAARPFMRPATKNSPLTIHRVASQKLNKLARGLPKK